MMSNYKTTLTGYAAIFLIVLYVLYGFYIGKPLDLEKVLQLLAAVAAGVGLINARDGGH